MTGSFVKKGCFFYPILLREMPIQMSRCSCESMNGVVGMDTA